MMSFKVKGLDKLRGDLERFKRNAEALHGPQSVPIVELLSPDFLRKHTRFGGFDQMMAAWGVSEFDKLDTTQRDALTRTHTKFQSFKEMMDKAVGEWGWKKILAR